MDKVQIPVVCGILSQKGRVTPCRAHASSRAIRSAVEGWGAEQPDKVTTGKRSFFILLIQRRLSRSRKLVEQAEHGSIAW
jgi:hypothetical protein